MRDVARRLTTADDVRLRVRVFVGVSVRVCVCVCVCVCVYTPASVTHAQPQW